MISTLWCIGAGVSIELAVRWAKRGDWPGALKGSLCALMAIIMAAAWTIRAALS